MKNLGTASIIMNNGLIEKATFKAASVIKLSDAELSKVKTASAAGELLVSKWFTEIEETELADRTKYKIEGKLKNVVDENCEIEYSLIEL